jgi:ribonucleoside-diphosphate reductase alpha chain
MPNLNLTANALEVLQQRYLLKDGERHPLETPLEMFRRVAVYIAQAESRFKSRSRKEALEERFFDVMRNLEFLPNSPTLMNAGTALGQLSACFVVPIYDSLEEIFEALKVTAKIHQTGGGTGFDFSPLRPRGDLVASTSGEASGPVSFMRVFDKTTEVIVQGGKRRGANMGILRCDHPDIFEFVQAKMNGEALANFNLSVGITDQFMSALQKKTAF